MVIRMEDLRVRQYMSLASLQFRWIETGHIPDGHIIQVDAELHPLWGDGTPKLRMGLVSAHVARTSPLQSVN